MKINRELLKKAISELNERDIKTVKSLVDARFHIVTKNSKPKKPLKKLKKDLDLDNQMDKNLDLILSEDWSECFSNYDQERKEYYVYFHGRPNSQKHDYPSIGVRTFLKPFYVGMGKGERAFNFLRSPVHRQKIKKVLSQGYSKHDLCHIIKTGLTEAQARELESKFILFFGISGADQSNKEKRKVLSTHKSCLNNSQYEAMPDKWLQYRY